MSIGLIAINDFAKKKDFQNTLRAPEALIIYICRIFLKNLNNGFP